MSDLQKLWNDFLSEWPISRIQKMTLSEYVGYGDKSTFTYSIETKYKAIGSIKGSSSYKFGIFKRNPNSEIKELSGTLHGTEYSWQDRFGLTEQEAFNEIRHIILKIIVAAQSGDLNALEKIALANIFKWKIAFLYQQQASPCIVNIFSKNMLITLTGLSDKTSFNELYSKLMIDYNKEKFKNIAEYGRYNWDKLGNYDSVYWFLGASHGTDGDQTERFLTENIWQNGLDGKAIDNVKEIKVGDKVAIKSVYTQTHGLPFNNGGNVASVMDIKAIGIVINNYGDGETLEVDWQEDFEKKTWYSFTYQPRLWKVCPTNWRKKALIDFTFNNVKQDYAKFINTENQNISDNDKRAIKVMIENLPLNSILYGPPGTGKTYHTIEAAVKSVEPAFFLNINSRLPVLAERRKEIKNKYNELVNKKCIRFVTFHQSYGYEEFVEGLRASETVSGDISYETENGIFKKICKDAENNLIQSEQSIAELDEKYKFEDALDHFKNTIFDDQENFPLTDSVSITFIEDNGFRYGGSTWKSSQIMKYDDLRLLYQNGVNTRQGIKNSNFVSGLAKQHASYFIKALDAIKAYIPENSSIQEQINKQNYCLVIDEINRGNISKIFGELITLIEPSKRRGESEELEVILPYSGGKFSVPKNLHIIGTMNTADRSLAMMDTALRRRFDFKEMMPKPELFEGCIIAGINLEQLLTTLNQRIEALYDREHTLGHAFLFPAYDAMQEGKEDKAFRELQSAFQNKIIPLLEEYFYEDWNKIRLVLGDNQKQDKSLQFVRETKIEYNELFGDSYSAEEYGQPESRYELASFDDDVWSIKEAYISIYSTEIS